MLKKQINFFTMLVSGLFFFILGICFFTNRLELWNWLYMMLVFGLLGAALMRLLNIIINYRKLTHRFSQITDMLMWFGILIFASANPKLFYSLFPRVIGAWILLHAIVKSIVLGIKHHDHLSGQLYSFIFLIIDLIMAFILLFKPNQFHYLISYGVGCYFMLYGGNMLLDFIRELLPDHTGSKIAQKIRLAIPPWLAAIVPGQLMHILLDKDDDEVAKREFEAVKKDIQTDLEVMVHLAPSGPAMFGHVDIVYRDLVISYGCYDPHNRHLFGTLGDGVVIVANYDDYLINSLENENKILVGFGINMNEHQKVELDKKILEIFGNFEDFQSDEELRLAGKPYKGECDDYISRVSRKCKNAHYYKIKEGRFRTFFVLFTNCVSFAAQMLGCIGLNMIDLSGIVSPGSYYDFLNNQFKSDKSFVISRKLYTKKDIPILKENLALKHKKNTVKV